LGPAVVSLGVLVTVGALPVVSGRRLGARPPRPPVRGAAGGLSRPVPAPSPVPAACAGTGRRPPIGGLDTGRDDAATTRAGSVVISP